MIDRRIAQLRKLFRQLNRRNIRMADVRGGEGQLLHLPRRRLRELFAAMAERHVPQARQAIDEFTPVRIAHPGALTRNPYERIFVIVWVKLWVHQMFLIRLSDLLHIYSHAKYSILCIAAFFKISKAVHNNRGGPMHAYLVQHGKAKSAEEDPNRGLSDEGREEVKRIAELLSELRITISLIQHSGKVRAEETAHILASSMRCTTGPCHTEGLDPTDDPSETANFLKVYTDDILIVG